MAELPTICIPTYPSVMGDVTQDLPVQAQSATHGTMFASQTMVSFVAENSDRQSMEASGRTSSHSWRPASGTLSFGSGHWVKSFSVALGPCGYSLHL